MNSSVSKRLLLAALVCSWLAAAGAGMWRLAAYSLTPGVQGAAPGDWPADAPFARDPRYATLVLALHPECPCSKATVEELDGILARAGDRLRVHALFVELPGLPEPVERSELWARAARIAGVELHKDVDGAAARRFGAKTSGETRLYGADGRLNFRGGVTVSRGHVGENPGAAAIVRLAQSPVSPRTPVVTPVFGCALWDKSSNP